jgi:hypothetical protein
MPIIRRIADFDRQVSSVDFWRFPLFCEPCVGGLASAARWTVRVYVAYLQG